MRGWVREGVIDEPWVPAAGAPAPEGSTAGPAVGAESVGLDGLPAEGSVRPE